MKKKIVSVLLCLAMSFALVVEAGAAAESFSDIEVQSEVFDAEAASEVETVSVEVPTEEIFVDVTEEVELEVPEEEIVPDTEMPVETPEVECPVEDVTTGVETPEVVPGEMEEAADLFSSGVSAEDAFVTEEVESAGAVELKPGEVLFSQWEQDPATLKWRLKDSPDILMMSVGTSPDSLEEGVADAAGAPVYVNKYFGPVTTKDAAGNIIHDAAVYYFDAEGYLVTGRSTIAEGTRGFGGAVITELPSECFFMDEANAEFLNETDVTATPFNSNLGQQQKNRIIWTEDAFHSYGADGDVVELEPNKVYKIDGDHYYLLAGGKPKVGTQKTTLDGKEGYYYFAPAANADEIPGKMLRNAWAKVGTHETKGARYWFFQSNGLKKETGIIAAKLNSDGKLYLLDKYGYLIKGKMTKAADGYYYASNKNGQCYTNKLVKIGKYRYYFVGSGKRATWKNKWVRCAGAGNRYYYFGSERGRVVEKKGWQKVTSGKTFVGWFYFTSGGNHYVNKWAGDRYFLEDGRLASGVVKVGTKHYFFEKSTATAYRGKRYKNTWINSDNKWYYATSKGPLLVNRWMKLQGYWYCFRADGSAKTNTKAKHDKEYGWLDSRGRFTTGWIVMNDAKNTVRYMDSKTGQVVKNTAKEIDGLIYHFDAKGNRISDVTKTKYFAKYKGSYYLECDRINGVMTVYNSKRNVPLKTIRVSVGNPWTPTRVGTFRLTRSLRWQPLMGPSWGQYGTHVNGGIFVHSVACVSANSYNLPVGEYLKLGNPASHGCIRCCVADAKWVYDNCNGSIIRVFDGTYTSSEAKKGPLGRNPLTPLRGAGNFDPTDPEVP